MPTIKQYTRSFKVNHHANALFNKHCTKFDSMVLNKWATATFLFYYHNKALHVALCTAVQFTYTRLLFIYNKLQESVGVEPVQIMVS